MKETIKNHWTLINIEILYPSPYMSDDSVEHSEPVSDFIKSMGYSVVNEDGETSKGKTR